MSQSSRINHAFDDCFASLAWAAPADVVVAPRVHEKDLLTVVAFVSRASVRDIIYFGLVYYCTDASNNFETDPFDCFDFDYDRRFLTGTS